MIGIVNYGLGNVSAFKRIFDDLRVDCLIAENRNQLQACSKIILPGVGSFDWAIQRLEHSGMLEELDRLAINVGVPTLGVCVGMQMMLSRSEEGECGGLGWIDGFSKLIGEVDGEESVRLPHMGWNNLELLNDCSLVEGLDHPEFYFLHSYAVSPKDENLIVAHAIYGQNITAIINRENLWGVQFHPEKSHANGMKLLSNFSEINNA